ncbi:MAG: S53 family peptidase [Bdellovibrionota bacterium]
MRLVSIKMMRAPRKAAAVLAISLLGVLPGRRVAGDGMARLLGHVPSKRMHAAEYLGAKDGSEPMRLAVVLKPRNQSALEEFLKRVQDPRDPQFHQFLTPAQFAAQFGPTDDDIQSVTDHFARYGMRVSKVHENRLVVDLEGATSQVEDSLQVQMHNYRLPSGRVAHAANNDPLFPAEIASKIHTVAGLNNFSLRRPHVSMGANAIIPHASVGDFMTPAKIKSVYSFDTLSQTGSGETLALFELDGYNASDIAGYASNFGFTAPTLQNVLVDGASGAAGSGAIEVTLDIELAAAVAPGLSKIMVYEGPKTDTGVLDTYSKIATDNLAPEVSTSWGASEDEDTSAFLNGENTIFQQMAAQGQSVFAATGDSGAFDDPNHTSNLSVDDPASQPYVTGVGGTTLLVTTANTYKSESAWGDTSRAQGGGGGVSKIWPIPSWQTSVGTSANGESTTHRMVPDVSLDANPSTGYPVYFQQPGQSSPWILVGGTSCAAPMWAAFLGLVNQKRVADGHARIGFANPSLYQVAKSAQYPVAFHDIADGSTNLNFSAMDDYDLATGWGSFNGAGLFNNLTAATLPAALSAPGVPASISVGAN